MESLSWSAESLLAINSINCCADISCKVISLLMLLLLVGMVLLVLAVRAYLVRQDLLWRFQYKTNLCAKPVRSYRKKLPREDVLKREIVSILALPHNPTTQSNPGYLTCCNEYSSTIYREWTRGACACGTHQKDSLATVPI